MRFKLFHVPLHKLNFSKDGEKLNKCTVETCTPNWLQHVCFKIFLNKNGIAAFQVLLIHVNRI